MGRRYYQVIVENILIHPNAAGLLLLLLLIERKYKSATQR